MDKTYHFDSPTQVVFWDVDGDHWIGGIAYGDVVICGCCGGVIPIEEIIEFAPADIVEPICAYGNWCDISDDIVGGEMPDSWMYIYEPYDPTDEEMCEMEAYYFANLQDKES